MKAPNMALLSFRGLTLHVYFLCGVRRERKSNDRVVENEASPT